MLSRLRTLSGEAVAMARQAWLLPRDVGAPVVPRDARDGDDVVVFLHGLFASAGVLRPLRAAVERHARVHAAALSFPPGPGAVAIAAELARLTAELPGRARIHLVGHSLGGIVARLHAVRARDPRVVQTISIASPFAGIRGAAIFPFGALRDFAPDGPLLRELRIPPATPIPHLSIIAADDGVIPAPVTQALPCGEVAVLHGLGHNAMLFDPRVATLVERRVTTHRAAASAV